MRIDSALAKTESASKRVGLLAEKAVALMLLDRLDEADRVIAEARPLLAKANRADKAELLFAEAHILGNRQSNVAATQVARECLDLRKQEFGGESLEAAGAQVLLARLLISQSQFDEGIGQARQAWMVTERLLPPGDPVRVDTGFQLAVGLVYSRQSREAETLLRALLGEHDLLPPNNPYRAKLPNMMGAELLSQGRLREAVPWLRQAVDVGERIRTQIIGERADNLSILGIALLMQDRPEDALPYFEKAVAMFGEARAQASLAGAWINGGTAADRAGDRQAGLAMREQGMAIFAAMPEQHQLGLALNRFKLAQSYAHAGRLEEAEAIATQATEVMVRLRPPAHFQTTNSAISLGWIKVLRGDAAQGLALVRDNFRLSVATNERLEVAKNQVVGVLDNVEAYSQALDAALRGGDRDFAFEVLQVMAESDASRAAVAVAAREGAADTALGRLLRERQEVASALVDAETALTRALALDATTKADRGRLYEARAEREAALTALDARLDREVPAFRTLLRPRRLLLAEAQARLGHDEVLLVAVEGDLGLVTMALTARDVAVGRADLRRHQVRALVRRIRAGIDAGDAAAFDMDAARTLHDALFTPEVKALVRRGTRLRLATGDILSALPLSLLASASGRFLIEDHALSVVPSIAAMGGARDARRGGGRLAAIGAPEAGGEGAGLATRAPALAALPGALREIKAVAHQLRDYGAPLVLTGAQATEPALRAADLSQYDVLLFATHGLVAGAFDAHSEPALVLAPGGGPVGGAASGADGMLTASEAARLDLQADWVILSACDTAAGDQPSAAGYTGLARAFLFAGARRVVASHWPVRDDISARISLGIVKGMKRSRHGDEALRAAILTVMNDRRLADARNPALWAPFMVVSR